MSSPSDERQVSHADNKILARGAAVGGIGRLVGRALFVAVQLIVARSLGPKLFGRYAIGWSLLNVLGVICGLGMESAVIRFGSQEVEPDAYPRRAIVFSGVVIAAIAGGTVAVTLYLAADWLAISIFHSPAAAGALRLFAPSFAFFAPMRVASAATQITKNMGYSVAFESLGQPFLALLFVVLLGLGGLSINNSIIALNASFAASTLALLIVLHRLYPGRWNFSRDIRKYAPDLLRFGAPAGLATYLTLITTRLDRLVLAAYRPEIDLGLYQAASQCAIIFAILLSSFTPILQPMIASLDARTDRQRIDALFKVSTRWAVMLSLPIYIVMVLAPTHVIYGIYGRDFAAASTVLIVLASAQMINAATGAVPSMLIMTGRHQVWATVSAGTLVISVALDVMIVPRFGPIGAAWVAVLTMTLLFASGLAYLRSRLGIWPYDRKYYKLILPGLLCGIVTLWIKQYLPYSSFSLGIIAVTAIGGFFAALIILGLDPDDSRIVSAAINKISSIMRT